MEGDGKKKNIYFESMCMVFILAYVTTQIESKGARVGGGFRAGSSRVGSSIRFGGSNTGGFGGAAKPNYGGSFGGPAFKPNTGGFSGSRISPGGYSSYGSVGTRWSSFGSGMLAYGVMSNLASRGHHHSGYNYRSSNGANYNKQQTKGSTCINNEDFNGTVFGTFQCPLPEFDPSASYCCGSASEETQYCCKFFDDNSRIGAVVLAVISFILVIVLTIFCVQRIMKRHSSAAKYDSRSPVYTQSPANFQNINRNINQPPRMQGPQNYNNFRRPPQQQQPFNGPRPQYPEQTPFIQHSSVPFNNNRPYPSPQMSMPQAVPMPMPTPNVSTNANQPPPSYNEVVK